MEINRVNSTNNSGNFTEMSMDPAAKAETVKVDSKDYNDNSSKKDTAVNQKELDTSVNRANKIFFKNNTHLQFKIHDVTHDVMVKIVDDTTGETLKEIPPEKFIDMMAKICEIAGIFVDEKR